MSARPLFFGASPKPYAVHTTTRQGGQQSRGFALPSLLCRCCYRGLCFYYDDILRRRGEEASSRRQQQRGGAVFSSGDTAAPFHLVSVRACHALRRLLAECEPRYRYFAHTTPRYGNVRTQPLPTKGVYISPALATLPIDRYTCGRGFFRASRVLILREYSADLQPAS